MDERRIEYGDIYYIEGGKFYMEDDNEDGRARPAIVVSDQMTNNGNRSMVVYLTRQGNGYPSCVPVRAVGVEGYAITNNIDTVYHEKFGDYAGKASADDMKEIRRQMRNSLNMKTDWINEPLCIGCQDKEEKKQLEEQVKILQVERDVYKRIYDDILLKLMNAAL